MFDSLRTRLLALHAITVVVVIVVFALSIGTVTWRSRLALVDEGLERRAALLIGAIQPASDGRIDVNLGPGLRPGDAPGMAHAIWSRDGAVVDRSPDEVELERPEGVVTRSAAGRREVVRAGPGGAFVQVSTDLSPVKGDVARTAAAVGVVGAVILLASVVAGRWLVGRALEPIDRINATAALMIGGDLSARIAVDSDSDIGRLGRAVNDAFDQLQAAVDRQRRFTADASHELRTPLTTLSTELQWALDRPRTVPELVASLAVCRRALERVQTLTARLLHLARAEAAPARFDRFDLASVVEHAVERVRPLASDLTITVQTEAAPIGAELSQTETAVGNVLENAARYNVPGGRIDVHLTRDDATVTLVVADTGVGISADDIPFVFDPFFRGDPARSRDTGGSGLGLALVRASIEQAGGQVRAENTVGRGTRLTLTWPLSATVDQATERPATRRCDPRREPPDPEARGRRA